MRPFTMLCGNLALTFGAFVLLLGLADFWSDILWISTAIAGLGLSTMFITAVIWISHVLPFSGTISSTIFTGTSIGDIVSPIATSQMIQKSAPMWCVVFEAVVSLGLVLVLVILLFATNSKPKAELGDQKLSGHTGYGEDDGNTRDGNG
jgi:MFS family permease